MKLITRQPGSDARHGRWPGKTGSHPPGTGRGERPLLSFVLTVALCGVPPGAAAPPPEPTTTLEAYAKPPGEKPTAHRPFAPAATPNEIPRKPPTVEGTGAVERSEGPTLEGGHSQNPSAAGQPRPWTDFSTSVRYGRQARRGPTSHDDGIGPSPGAEGPPASVGGGTGSGWAALEAIHSSAEEGAGPLSTTPPQGGGIGSARIWQESEFETRRAGDDRPTTLEAHRRLPREPEFHETVPVCAEYLSASRKLRACLGSDPARTYPLPSTHPCSGLSLHAEASSEALASWNASGGCCDHQKIGLTCPGPAYRQAELKGTSSDDGRPASQGGYPQATGYAGTSAGPQPSTPPSQPSQSGSFSPPPAPPVPGPGATQSAGSSPQPAPAAGYSAPHAGTASGQQPGKPPQPTPTPTPPPERVPKVTLENFRVSGPSNTGNGCGGGNAFTGSPTWWYQTVSFTLANSASKPISIDVQITVAGSRTNRGYQLDPGETRTFRENFNTKCDFWAPSTKDVTFEGQVTGVRFTKY